MAVGTVKWFNDAKGYGFINGDEGDVFVHYSAIRGDGRRTLVQDEPVEYTVKHGPKGLYAVDVLRSNFAVHVTNGHPSSNQIEHVQH